MFFRKPRKDAEPLAAPPPAHSVVPTAGDSPPAEEWLTEQLFEETPSTPARKSSYARQPDIVEASFQDANPPATDAAPKRSLFGWLRRDPLAQAKKAADRAATRTEPDAASDPGEFSLFEEPTRAEPAPRAARENPTPSFATRDRPPEPVAPRARPTAAPATEPAPATAPGAAPYDPDVFRPSPFDPSIGPVGAGAPAALDSPVPAAPASPASPSANPSTGTSPADAGTWSPPPAPSTAAVAPLDPTPWAPRPPSVGETLALDVAAAPADDAARSSPVTEEARAARRAFRWTRRRAAADTASGPSTPADPPADRSSAPDPVTDDAGSPAAVRGTPRTARTGRRAGPRGAPVSPYLLLDVGGDRTLVWQVLPSGVERRDRVPAGALALSFVATDWRVTTDGPVSGRALATLLLELHTEPVYALNRSKDLGAVYATPQNRVADLPYRIAPGALLLDTLSRGAEDDGDPAVLGFQLKDAEGRDAVVILVYRAPSGEWSAPQISIYPDDPEFVLAQFATLHQARAGTPVRLQDAAALREAAASVRPYPNEALWGPVPVRHAWTYAAAASVLAAVACVGYATTSGIAKQLATTELATLSRHTARVEAETTHLIETSSVSFARGLSLDLPALLHRSQALWVPGSRVRVTSDGSLSDFTVTLPLASRSAGRSLGEVTSGEVVDQLRTLTAPAGCRRQGFAYSSTLNEVTLTVRCEDPASRLARYRDR